MKAFAWILAAAMLSIGGGLQAQQPGLHLGVGVSLNPAAIINPDNGVFLPVGLGNIYLPVQLVPWVRLEPEVGLFRVSQKASGTGFSSSETSTVLRLGIGVFYVFPADHGFRAYIGPRAGLIRTSDKFELSGSPSTSTKRTDHFLGIALGGEYLFTPHFSLGAEAQLNRISIGDEETDPPSPFPPSGTSDQSVLSNNGLIFVRWYFW
jgi:hypothetical protein